jgi:hypothetical protein
MGKPLQEGLPIGLSESKHQRIQMRAFYLRSSDAPNLVSAVFSEPEIAIRSRTDAKGLTLAGGNWKFGDSTPRSDTPYLN